MNPDVPIEARPVARILLAGPELKLLLLQAEEAGHRWWLTPGGGLEPGESFEQAAARELYEETGIQVQIGRWVWTRRHIWSLNGRSFDQYERFFLATTEHADIQPHRPDSYVIAYRWWSLQELEASTDDFAPRRLPELWQALTQGKYPEQPIDCGV